MRTQAVAVVAILLALFAPGGSVSAEPTRQPPPAAPAFRVIVNSKNTLSSVERTFLQDAFLKKSTRWPNDTVIRPVDLVSSSSVRSKFSSDVIGRSVAAVKAYWQQRIFAGRDVPPIEVENDARVVEFVKRYEGAVGYVSAAASLDGAKEIAVSR
jgi:ABC-type phosphate transport system substrate-binding protein